MELSILFAPLEGVTDSIFRRIHNERFGGIERYYIPFISPTQHLAFTSREQRAVSPIENEGVPVVPQVLTNNADHFVATARMLHDVGYEEVNLNMGCPSGTVTAKYKGSGMLRDLTSLERFLDGVFASPPCPISIKTRIGFESPDEWTKLWELLSSYPIHRLIVHPRTRQEYYKGTPHVDAFALCDDAPFPCVYNGDVNTIADIENIASRFPGCSAVMIGRGLVANPALARQWQGGDALNREELIRFHELLLTAYSEKWPPKAVLGHMQEIMFYLLCCFEDTKKIRKAMRKAQNVAAYQEAARCLFEECPFRDEPAFSLDID